jgi:indolepyruvate ferredoxin oxidoreductase beta subunit
MSSGAVNIVLAGVGGQGSVLATRILAGAARRCGCDVVTSEVHGMAQRGGTVTTTVRYRRAPGPVLSPVIGPGEADVLVAFEWLECARHLPLLRLGGLALVNQHRILPSVESLKAADYPGDLEALARAQGVSLETVPATMLALELSEPKLASAVLLGGLSDSLDLPVDAWRGAIAEAAPAKLAGANLAAFESGREWLAAQHSS